MERSYNARFCPNLYWYPYRLDSLYIQMTTMDLSHR
jgi:hypothetical protein